MASRSHGFSTAACIAALWAAASPFQVAGGPHGPSNSLRGRTAEGSSLDQVLVFDAGSSGTRIHVFNLVPPLAGAHVPTIDLSVRGAQTLKVKPGLSYYAANSNAPGARKSVEDLLQFADKFVPQGRRADTPVLLKATAGLRSVSVQQADAVLEEVRAGIMQSGYKFRPEWADIIKGKEEAGLAWVAANYLRGTFGGSSNTPSLGVIEMGGGSTQVSFEVGEGDKVAEDDNFVFVTAENRQFPLYAHSYLGFGQDHAQARLRSSLPLTATQDPCYPKGYLRQAPKGQESVKIVVGAGNAESCQDLIWAHLFGRAGGPGQYESERPLKGSFAATENFVHVRGELGAAFPLQADAATMNSSAKMACERGLVPSAEEIQKMQKGESDVGKPNNCFGTAYQAILLRVLGVPTIPGVDVQIIKQIGGADVDWALGAALVHALEGYRVSATVAWPAWFWLGLAISAAASFYLLSRTLKLCTRSGGAIASQAVKATVVGSREWRSPRSPAE